MKTLAYKFELRPGRDQEQSFLRFAGQCRFVFNQLLRKSKDAHEAGEKFPLSSYGLCYEVTKLKAEFEWLKESHVHCLQKSAGQLAKAFDRWFKSLKGKGPKSGAPRFKPKHDGRRSFSYKSGIKVDGDKVWLPKIGWVKFRKSRDLIGKLKTATVSRSASGKWFVSISAEREIEHKPQLDTVRGMDVGLSTFATFDDGEKVESPKWLRRSEKKLKRLQRSLSRKKKGSANRAKAKRKVARHHERVANQRRDFQHKLSTRLSNDTQVLGCEDLSLKGLVRTRLAKSFSDAGLGEFFRQLEYKFDWYGRTLVRADRFFASSKLCSCCREKNDGLALSDRTWTCAVCETKHDRDINAAINLKNVAVGYMETLNACGESVSHA